MQVRRIKLPTFVASSKNELKQTIEGPALKVGENEENKNIKGV